MALPPTSTAARSQGNEPHSDEITHLMLVFLANFPEHRALRELHQYFPEPPKEGLKKVVKFPARR
ncbi:MAG: hypothetical protein ACTSUE_06685 [Promethearchaeota archaeon]